jgi:hypothetical protein
MRLFVVLLLIAAVSVALHSSEGSAARGGAATVLAVAPAAAGVEAVTASASRTRNVVGKAATAVLRPTVTGMTEKTARHLAELEPAIRRATPYRAERARRISRQVRDMNETAVASLDNGRPIDAFRFAMRSRNLVDAVRHQVLEDMIR